MFICTGISIPQATQSNGLPSTTPYEKVLKPKSKPPDNAIGPYVTLYITCIIVVKKEQEKSENSKRLLCMARNLNEVRVRQNSTSKTSNTVSDEIKEIISNLEESLKHKNNGEKPNNENIVPEKDAEVFDPLMKNPPNASVFDIPCSANSLGQKLLKLVAPLIIRKDPQPSITGKLFILIVQCAVPLDLLHYCIT